MTNDSMLPLMIQVYSEKSHIFSQFFFLPLNRNTYGMAAGVGMLLRISFPCSVGKQKFAVNYFRDLLVAPQIEPIFTILSFQFLLASKGFL